jgi:hypothetical protein
MRKPATARIVATDVAARPVVAGQASVQAGRHMDAPAELVCLALVLALIALAIRIVAVW